MKNIHFDIEDFIVVSTLRYRSLSDYLPPKSNSRKIWSNLGEIVYNRIQIDIAREISDTFPYKIDKREK